MSSSKKSNSFLQKLPVLWKTTRQSRWFWPSLAVIVLLITTAGGLWRRFSVETVITKRGTIVEAVYALGSVKSRSVFTVKLGIPAVVQKLPVREGDQVSDGDILVITDSLTMRAPFAGTVTRHYVEQGETVLPGSPILTMMNLRDLEIELSLDQESALKVKPGQTAQLSFESLRGKKLSGKVTKRYPGDGQFIVKVQVPDLPAEILPEMTADVAIEVDRKENALLVPLRALRMGQVRRRRDGGISRRVPVTLGAIDTEWAEVIDGDLQEGDVILLGRDE